MEEAPQTTNTLLYHATSALCGCRYLTVVNLLDCTGFPAATLSAVSQLYLFAGENAFQLREERKAWKSQFAAKHGEENLLMLFAPAVTYRTLLDEASIAPFIGDKRLIIIDGIPRFEKEEMEALPRMLHPATLLVFCDPKPDKRLGGVKALMKIATMKEFLPLQRPALLQWIRSRSQAIGSPLDATAAAELVDIVGEDQEMLSMELEKLATFTGAAVTADIVRRLAVPSGEQEIWELTARLASGDTREAIRYARRLQQSGEDPYSLWAILLWMLRSLASVCAAIPAVGRNPAAIASAAGVPFPTAKNLLPLAEKLDPVQLGAIICWAADTDVSLKTGGYRVTGDAPQELQSLIDSLILRCAVQTP